MCGGIRMVNLQLSDKDFRRLVDMVYIGNWILNSTRGEERFTDYDEVQRAIFSKCAQLGMEDMYRVSRRGHVVPSKAFEEGGIHEAILDYEDTIFFEILAEELARRDMNFAEIDDSNCDELESRMDEYIAEFEENGVENITLDK